jgi:dihydropyrimidine dehydrogenase (NADP+)/dihydropyrimidine dehydrogenase (NAD+) subunit PreA
MGSAMGESPAILQEVAGWVDAVAKIPVWAKLTPNITHIEAPTRAAFQAGCAGVSAINTIRSILGVNLETLRPEPTVEGYSTPGGYSSRAVLPIALSMCMEIAQVIRDEYPDRSLSGIGGIETGEDAAQFLLLGADTVQVCTGVMKSGYRLVHQLSAQLLAFMERHQFETIDDFRGHSLAYLTTHADLVARQAAARAGSARAEAQKSTGQPLVEDDNQWRGDDLVDQSDALSRG